MLETNEKAMLALSYLLKPIFCSRHFNTTENVIYYILPQESSGLFLASVWW